MAGNEEERVPQCWWRGEKGRITEFVVPPTKRRSEKKNQIATPHTRVADVVPRLGSELYCMPGNEILAAIILLEHSVRTSSTVVHFCVCEY
jgi:hypothetical protein